MQAGEAWWCGRDDHLKKRIDEKIPTALSPIKAIASSATTSGHGFRRGIGYRREAIENFDNTIGPFYQIWRLGMELDIAATESTDRAAKAIENLDAIVKNFREKIKNDTASMKAASERVQGECARMSVQYRQAQELLISPEFERAIANAERMATALQSISALSETRLSVAVFSGGNHD